MNEDNNNKIIIKLKGPATARKYEEDELFQRDKFEEIGNYNSKQIAS